jgi:hypothetical protein
MGQAAPKGNRDSAIYDLLLRSRFWEGEIDLHDTRARVNRALAADDVPELRRALLDDIAASIAVLEELPLPDDLADET